MLEIKKAGLEDVSAIQQLTYTIWPHTYRQILSEKQLQYMLELFYCADAIEKLILTPQYQFIIILDNEIPLGFAAYSPKIINHPFIYRLHKLYVLPSQQGKGLGSSMIKYIIHEIIPLGANILELNVNRYNKAQDFYFSQGFVVISEEDIDIGNGYFMNDYVMEKKLVAVL